MAWSFSSLTKYDTCPRQYYEVKIAKNFVDERTDESLWGNAVHEAIENHIGANYPLGERFKVYEPQVTKVREHLWSSGGEFAVELELGIDETLTEGRAFDDPTCYARCIIDVLCIKGNVALNIDWKTGKVRESSGQLRMSSGIVFANFPQVEVVHAGYVWLAHGITTREEWHRTDDIWSVFKPMLNRLRWSELNESWPPKPSGLCKKWCPVKTCEYNGRGRR